MDQALLARIEAQDDVALVATDDLGVGAGRAGDRAALADLHLHIVDDGADRNIADRHGVAGLDVDLLACNDLVANSQALRRNDIGQRVVGVTEQGDERRAVRIVFDPLDLRRHRPACRDA